MDDPALDADAHHAALRSLARVHRLSGTGHRLRRRLTAIAAGLPPDRPLRLLDVACGGGDLCLDAARWARSSGRAVEVVGLDLSPRALDFGATRARKEELSVEWVRGDALSELPEGRFDLACSSLFLHHLAEAEAAAVLAAMARRADHLLVEDLRRSRLGLWLAHLTLTLLAPSRVARVDGPRSVRAAWTRGEFEALAGEAGLGEWRVRSGWPQRWILTADPA